MKVYHTKEFMQLSDSVKNLYFYLLLDSVDNFVNKPKQLFETINAKKEYLQELVDNRLIFLVKEGIYIVTNSVDYSLLKGVQIVKKEVSTPKKEVFVKPTIEEVRDYCLERNNGVDYIKFYNFYESKGWLVGKVKMKSWKSAVITWEKSIIPTQSTQNNLGDLL